MRKIITHRFFFTLLLLCAQQSIALGQINTNHEKQLIETLQHRKPLEIHRNVPQTKTFFKTTNTLPKLLEKNTGIQPLIIKFPISIFNRTAHQNLHLFYSELLQPITLQDIQFEQPVNISMTYFAQPIKGYNLRFHDAMTLNYCLINQTLLLHGTHYYSKVNFTANTFNKSVNLTKSTFNKTADFSGSTFRQGINLSWSKFNKKLNLNHAIFYGNSNLSNTTLNQNLNLSDSSLHGSINLLKLLIKGKINLKNLSITGKEKLDLTRIETPNINKQIPINLENTTLTNVLLDYRFFHLYFDKKTSHFNKMKTYTNLLEHFKKEGRTKSHEKLFQEYRSYQLQYHKQHVLNQLSKHFWNYGTDKTKALHWIFILYVIFSMINAALFPTLAKDYPVISSFSNVHLTSEIKHNAISRFVCYLPFSAFFTLFLMTGGFLRLGLNIATLRGYNLLISTYILIVCITGFLGMLFIISLIL